MGCNCGNRANQTIAQRSQQSRAQRAAFQAIGSPLGFDRDNPLLIGETGDGELWRVRVMAPVEGLTAGQAAWVTGKGVAEHLASGALFDITSTAQKGRLFRVGADTYTSRQDAERVAAVTGQTVVEIA